MKKLVSIIMALTLAMALPMTAKAYTPMYDVDMPEIPDIHVELSDQMKDAINQAVQKQLEKMVLSQPVITNAYHWKTRYSSRLYVTWNPVECATSHKVEITKADGTVLTYDARYNWLYLYNTGDLSGATVRVKSYGEDETYSLWSELVEIRRQ